MNGIYPEMKDADKKASLPRLGCHVDEPETETGILQMPN